VLLRRGVLCWRQQSVCRQG